MPDHLIRILTRDGALRACAAETTDLVEEIRRRQQTDPTATVAVGRLATAAALMSSLLKGKQRLGLTIEANGPLRKLQAEADSTGAVRATVKQPVAGLPPREDRFDVAGAIGRAGFLHVVKDLGLKEPYRGMVQLYTSEVAEDIAYYFTTSEQTPSSVGLGVTLDNRARVAAAGGFLLQLMPDAEPTMAATLETRLKQLPPTTRLLCDGVSPGQLLDRLLYDIPYEVLGQTPLMFSCSCTRDQTGAILRTLGREELEQLMQEHEVVTVTCEFCKERYRFDQQALEALMAQQ
jgi:molecular chaperone Hsp33